MPGIIRAFFELIREIPADLTNLFRALFAGAKRAFGGLFWLFTSPLGLWVTNIATVIGTLLAVAQYKFFEQIPEVQLQLCQDQYAEENWDKMLANVDKTIFFTIDYSAKCPEKREKQTSKTFEERLGSAAEISRFDYHFEAMFSIFTFYSKTNHDPTQIDSANPVDILSDATYQIRIATPINARRYVFARETHMFKGPHFIKLDYTSTNITLTLIPAPYTSQLGRQLACHSMPWPVWAKELFCPFLRPTNYSSNTSTLSDTQPKDAAAREPRRQIAP